MITIAQNQFDGRQIQIYPIIFYIGSLILLLIQGFVICYASKLPGLCHWFLCSCTPKGASHILQFIAIIFGITGCILASYQFEINWTSDIYIASIQLFSTSLLIILFFLVYITSLIRCRCCQAKYRCNGIKFNCFRILIQIFNKCCFSKCNIDENKCKCQRTTEKHDS